MTTVAERTRPLRPTPPIVIGTWLRLVLALVAAEATALALLLWRLRPQEAFVPDLWPVLFGVGAAGTVVLLVQPCHRWALHLSIVGLVCGHAGRTLAVAANLNEGTVLFTTDRAWLVAILYATVAALIAYVWLGVLGPVVEGNRQRRRCR